MNDLHYCLDCQSVVDLDRHGRCNVCCSDAVLRRSLQHLALLSSLYRLDDSDVATLEKLWLLK